MMEDGPFTPNSMFGTDNTMDLDLINELLYDGYWLHTAEGSEFWQPALSSPSTLNFSSSFVPTSETKTDDLNPLPFKEGAERLGFGSNPPPLVFSQMGEPAGSQPRNQEVNLVSPSSGPPENFAEVNKTLWISPLAKATPASSLKERLMKAINHLKESTKDGDVLIQIWVPVKKGGKSFLTTNNQPFSVTSNSQSLADYRMVSSTYEFPADENSKVSVGLPGRVFLKKLPEWTPDVRFFKTEEYPRVNYAQQYNVSGSLALPVFERGSGSCLGVVEIVTTTCRVNYRPELESVCRALEAVNLRSSDIRSPPTFKGCGDSYQAVLAEVRDVLRSVCDAHGLPLAQTWAPCFEQSKSGCRHSDENYTHCVSTVDSACYVRDPRVADFHDACSEHHLIRGEGVVGGAFMTNQPCFASDITALTKTEYPLSHHARIFKLHAAVAIRLRSIYTGSSDFVLEFFLPSECRDVQEQRLMLGSLSSVIQQVCRSLRVVTDQEISEERLASERIAQMSSLPKESSQEEASWVAQMAEAQQKGKAVVAPLGYEKVEPEEFQPMTHWENPDREFHQDSKGKGSVEGGGDFSSSFGGSHQVGVRKAGEKRRTKTEKTISMDVLRQYFAGSLKDAAKSIGVCPTTLKRICRQHGITRWPSRKIKKVGHSLKKLQLVIDSVQGVEGSIQLSSFYTKFPELSSPGVPGGTHSGSTSTVNDQLRQFNPHADGTSLLSPVTNTSKSPSSSCSHSSSSSFSCPSEAKHPPPISANVPGGDATLGQLEGLKRAHSETELRDPGQEETKLLVRSQSHKFFNEAPAQAQAQAQLPKSEGTGFRVKVIFGEENIRFKIPESYGFGDIQHEIGKRFNIDDTGKIDLKYLDDDNEWVLLTCDADLEECIDIHRSSRSRTIKLSVHQPSNAHFGSSIGSNGLL